MYLCIQNNITNKNNHTMRRILLSMLVCLASISTFAQLSVKIITKSGETISIAFKDRPVLTYEQGNIVIKSEVTQSVVSYPLSDLASSEITGTPGEVDGIESISYGQLKETATVYTLDGVLVKSIPSGTSSALPFSELREGTYIVKKGNITHKIQIKK